MRRTTVTTWSVNLILLVLLCSSAPAASRVIYVDDDATSPGDGSSWNTAYRFLRDALADANTSPKPVEVWVAQGLYRPDRSASHPNGTGDRTATFQLINGVALKGGYAGVNEPDSDARDIEKYQTILSGDLAGNDIQLADPTDLPSEPTRADNSCNVVTAAGCDRATLIEGFTITAGNATGPILSGGGIYNGKPTVSLCTIVANSASTGGGIYFEHAAHEPGALLKDSTITHNSANSGGGVYGCAEVVNCTFTDNTAVDGYAGALNLGSDCETTVTNCTFSRNYAAEGAGAVYLDASGTEVTFTRCAFVANSSGARGGAILSDGCTCGSYPTFYQCTFIANTAAGNGGAICDYGFTDTQLYSCLLIGNSSGENGGALCDEYDGGSALINCTVSNNTAAGQGGGICYDRYSYKGRRLANTIIWANSDKNGQTHQYSQIYLIEVSELQDVTHCCIQVIPPGIKGQGNITSNPLFVDIDGPDNIPGNGDDNLHLLEGSACIDTGHNEYLPPQAIDLDGEPRINGIVDRGAYEYSPQHSRIIYVDDSATGLSTGTSWKDAFEYLQLGILTALAGDEIRVAQGTYRPNEGIIADVPDDRALTFQLRNGVTIKGGYAGFGQPDPDNRNIEVYKTILSGDVRGNDVDVSDPCLLPSEPTRSDNNYHVVTGSGTDETTKLDGFTITGGRAIESGGGGMCNIKGSPTISSCTFLKNTAYAYESGAMGGGLYNQHGSPTLVECRFISNVVDVGIRDHGSGHGAAIYAHNGRLTLTNCLFSKNVAAGNNGGAVYVSDVISTLIGCTFENNSARMYGGGMCNWSGNPTLLNCTFVGNSSQGNAGGMYITGNGTLTACVFVANSSAGRGGAMECSGSGSTITNCAFLGNAAESWAGGIYCTSSTLTLANCTFAGNTALYGNTFACYSWEKRYPSTIHIADSIIWDKSQILFNDDSSAFSVRFANVRGGWPGQGNINADPLFADANNHDYHLKSQAGRWDPNNGEWVQDNVTSPCIDAGDAMSPIGYEPFPNGGRVNMGDYGGTAEASKSWFGGPVCETIIAGDINGDCKVDFTDFAIMALHWLNDYSFDQEH